MGAIISVAVLFIIVFLLGMKFGWNHQHKLTEWYRGQLEEREQKYDRLQELSEKMLATNDHLEARLKEVSGENTRLKTDNKALEIQLGRTAGTKGYAR